MKTRSRVSVACCAAVLVMGVPLMTRAAHNTLLLKDAEPQYASHLCWAAADVLAVNQFFPTCPKPPPTNPGLFPTSQALEGAYNESLWDTGSGSDYLSHLSGPFGCETSIGNCNDWGWSNPPLNGLHYQVNSGTKGLDWATIKQQIDSGRPVLFVWKYPDDNTQGSPVDNHEMVVIGYSDDTGTQKLTIWDPWPVPESLPNPLQVPACGPASGIPFTDHSQTILFTTYQDPSTVDMGVTAVHANDQWDLAIAAPPNDHVPQPPVLTVDGAPPPLAPLQSHEHPQPPAGPPEQLSFDKALSVTRPESQRLDLQVPGAAARTLGVPFPIVGLGFQQLLRAEGNPTALLAGTASAVLYPVESQGEVVDAFLLLVIDGRPQRGGYANIEITRRLVKVRAAYAAQHRLPLKSFYMVSVPGEVAFFAAYGQGKKAILIPASTDPTIHAVAGVAVPAGQQLKELIVAIENDLRRDRSRGAGTPR
jgi:hypothetical protein